MAHNVLQKAQKLFTRKKFSAVLSLLEPKIIDFRDSSEYFYLLAVSCMYMGDLGGAQSYLQRGRQISLRSPKLLLAQAALFLRKGDTGQAVEFYLETLEYDPKNKIAKKAMQFIRKHGDDQTLTIWIQKEKIKQFYPSTGIYIPVLPLIIFSAALITTAIIAFMPNLNSPVNRADLSNITLSNDEKTKPVVADLSVETYNLLLSADEVNKAYLQAQTFFHQYRDNSALVEINRILNSNAIPEIKQKALLLKNYLSAPSFESLVNDEKENFPYQKVIKTPLFYSGCWVVWRGTVANVIADENEFKCDFVIGYDTLENRIDGIIPLSFHQPVTIDRARSLQVLGNLTMIDGKIALEGKTIYQPLPERN
ncbi:MAG: tetratricopeptide repeat protein [Treponemataceae bacterium]